MRQHQFIIVEQPHHHQSYRRTTMSRLLVCSLGALLGACGSASQVEPPQLAPTMLAHAPATETQLAPPKVVTPVPTSLPTQPAASAGKTPSSAPKAIPTMASTTRVVSSAPARPGGPGDDNRPSPVPDPAERLRHALELADTEMRAVGDSTDLNQAKLHAEAIVNILVGLRGRWYGDADGDGKITDPSDGQGVLPGSGTMAPARDLNARRQLGWGQIVYLKGDQDARQFVQGILMGNMERWINQPERRYDAIEQAIAGTDLHRNMASKLDGHAMRIIVWARLILTQASSIDDAKAYARNGIADTSISVDAARRIR